MVRHDIVKLIKWNDNFLIEKAKRIGHLAPSANLGNSCVIGRKLSGSYYSLQMGVDAGRADSAWHLLNTNGLSVIIPDWEGVLICLPKWWDCRFLRCWDYFINSSLFFATKPVHCCATQDCVDLNWDVIFFLHSALIHEVLGTLLLSHSTHATEKINSVFTTLIPSTE